MAEVVNNNLGIPIPSLTLNSSFEHYKNETSKSGKILTRTLEDRSRRLNTGQEFSHFLLQLGIDLGGCAETNGLLPGSNCVVDSQKKILWGALDLLRQA